MPSSEGLYAMSCPRGIGRSFPGDTAQLRSGSAWTATITLRQDRHIIWQHMQDRLLSALPILVLLWGSPTTIKYHPTAYCIATIVATVPASNTAWRWWPLKLNTHTLLTKYLSLVHPLIVVDFIVLVFLTYYHTKIIGIQNQSWVLHLEDGLCACRIRIW